MERQSLIFVRSRPRTIVLRPAVNVSNTALVFECLEAGTTVRSTARFQPSSTLNFATFRPLHLRPVFGCLGLVQVLDDLFIGIVTEAAKVGDLEGSPIYRIHKVAFYSLLSDKYDYQSPDATDGLRSSNPVGTLPEEGPSLHPCASLVKLLSTGSFYFSPVLDLTRSTQKRAVDAQQGASEISILESADAHFVWNKHLLSGLLQIREQELTAEERDDLDKGGLLITAMQGYVGMIDFSISSLPCRMALISRLSCKRAGTRLLSRGVNDDGHVSNFVETEFIIFIGQSKFSFVQIRGSVPVFWEQTGIQMTHKVTISRGAESSAPATRMHFMDLLDRYGRVHIVNLLGQGSSEQMLSELYRTSVMSMRDLAESVTYTEFDFHQKVKNGGYERLVELVTEIRKILDSFSFFLYDQDTKSIVLQQQGAVRTNCLDCLDRTNVVQTRIAKYVMDVQLRQLGKQFGLYEEESFATAFNGLWADNGDWLSRIYAGTGAMKSSYTRKGKATVLGFLDDAAKSVNRFVINNFQDKTRQEAIDLLLGKLALPGSNILLRNPMHDAVVKEMKARLHEYSSARMVTLFLGTWNVNGRQSRGESLNSWLFSDKVKFPEVYAIGVQELIELTPGAYITIDTNKLRLEWEATLKAALNSQSDTSYVLLRSLHLVALGLFVFVRSDCVGMIRHVESSTKKTGMGGMAANKGGIGLSLSIHDTSVAFVTAHLAAGQGAVDERNRDYWTIHNGLSFRGRKLAEHDMTFWFGDFNYRINRSNEEVRMSIRKGDLEALYMNDQLYDQRAQGRAFDEFLEGPITFDPTYKYDNNTVTYDTSEKCRIPAWTDRILYKGRSIDLKEYQRAELLMSDHRPVRAIFELQTSIVDKVKEEAIRKEVYAEKMATKDIPPPLPVRPQGPPRNVPAAPSTDLLINLAEDDDEPQQTEIPPSAGPVKTQVTGSAPDLAAVFGFRDSFPPKQAESLPAPSSERSKWWERDVGDAWIPQAPVEDNPFYDLSNAPPSAKSLDSIATAFASLSTESPKNRSQPSVESQPLPQWQLQPQVQRQAQPQIQPHPQASLQSGPPNTLSQPQSVWSPPNQLPLQSFDSASGFHSPAANRSPLAARSATLHAAQPASHSATPSTTGLPSRAFTLTPTTSTAAASVHNPFIDPPRAATHNPWAVPPATPANFGAAQQQTAPKQAKLNQEMLKLFEQS